MTDNVIELKQDRIVTKDFSLEAFEIKQDGEERTVEGYITTFGNKDSYNDVIVKGAFGKSFKPNKIKFLYQHDWKEVIGIMDSVKEDSHGIWVKAKFANTPRAQEAYELMKMGALDSFSIGFRIEKFNYEKDGSRTISKGHLMEASVVTFPANEMAQAVSVKGLDDNGHISKRDFEDMLKQFGFSQKESCMIVSKSYEALESHWDNGCEDKEDNQSDSDLKQMESILDDFLNKLKGK